ncbi:MAG: secreted protein [Pseudarthrobacter sp.]|nr:secreted protein [Pseudarthrobacter sp.]
MQYQPAARSLFLRAAASVAAGAACLGLAACSPVVDVSAAQDAANPACAPMMVALPDAIGDAGLRKTNSQATAAWGDPSRVILRCGVNVPGPTTDRCVSVNGVDWVIKEGDPVYTLTTFGREPATEVLMDPDAISSATVLADLSAAAAKVPATGNCVGQEELQNLPTSQ